MAHRVSRYTASTCHMRSINPLASEPTNRKFDADRFVPAWWLPGPHLPTLWAALIRRRSLPAVRHERLELTDGDFLDLCWAGTSNGPLVAVLHGLEGSSRSKYAIALLERIERRGWGGVIMQFRGCSGEPNRRDRSYHAGDTLDFEFLFQEKLYLYRYRFGCKCFCRLFKTFWRKRSFTPSPINMKLEQIANS